MSRAWLTDTTTTTTTAIVFIDSDGKERDGNSEFVYLLCMREVPRYLQARLCQSPASGRSTRFTDGEEDEETLVRLPPVPQFKFVQDNQVREMQRTIIFSLDH